MAAASAATATPTGDGLSDELETSDAYRPRPASHDKQWPRAGPLLKHHAQIDLIDAHWDDLLRIGGSLPQGYVSAALLIYAVDLPRLRRL